MVDILAASFRYISGGYNLSSEEKSGFYYTHFRYYCFSCDDLGACILNICSSLTK